MPELTLHVSNPIQENELVKWRQLKHDFDNALKSNTLSDEKRIEFENQLQSLIVVIDAQNWPEWQSLKRQMAAIKEVDAIELLKALNSLDKRLLPSASERVSIEKLYELCQRLSLHWKDGLIPHLETFKNYLMNAPDSDLRNALLEWYQFFPAANFKSAKSLLLAAEELESCFKKFPLPEAPVELATHFHNTVKQHLAMVLNLLKHHEQQLLEYSPSSRKSLKSDDLKDIQDKLTALIPAPSLSQNRLQRMEQAQIHRSRKSIKNTKTIYILILEDDLSWIESLSSVVFRVLQDFCKTLFSEKNFSLPTVNLHQFENLFQVKSFTCVQDAKAFIDETKDVWLVISDLSVPQSQGEDALRQNGIQFLSDIRLKTTHYLPLIVHSTSAEYLSELHELRQLGIEDLDLLLKGNTADLETSIKKHLLIQYSRHIQTSQSKYELTFNGSSFQLNNVELTALTHRSKELLKILFNAAKSHRKVESVEEIFAHLYPTKKQIVWHDIRDQRFELVSKNFSDSDRALMIMNDIRRTWDVYRHDKQDLFDPDENPLYRWNRFLDRSTMMRKSLTNLGDKDLLRFISELFPDFQTINPRERIPVFFSPQPDWHPVSEQTKKVSDCLYNLKSQIKKSFEQVGKTIQVDHLIVSVQEFGSNTYRLSESIQVLQTNLQVNSDTVWKILLVENLKEWAQAIIQALEKFAQLSNQTFEIRQVWYVDQTAEILADWIPDLVLLDLHLPQSRQEFDANPDSGDAEAGYLVWNEMRKLSIAPKILITSTLSDDYQLRRMGLQQNLEARNYILKGGQEKGANWSDTFALQLKRILAEIELGALLPEAQFTHTSPDSLPLEVEILLCETPKGKKKLILNLRVTDYSGEMPIPYEMTFSADLARMMFYLLKHLSREVTQSELGLYLYGEEWYKKSQIEQKDALENKRNQIRKIIKKSLPVNWLKLENPGVQILKQNENTFSLNIRKLNDPKQYLKVDHEAK